MKRREQADLRRGRRGQFVRSEIPEYGGGCGTSQRQRKEYRMEKPKSREVGFQCDVSLKLQYCDVWENLCQSVIGKIF